MSAQLNPLVTVSIPSYNHSKFIRQCIQSVINQDYHNIELIIIDDGSTDNSFEIIQDMKELCLKRFVRFEVRSRPNKGLCTTLNEALSWAQGEYFSPIASDDIMMTNKTSFLIKQQLKTKASVVFGSAQKINSTGQAVGNLIRKGNHLFHDLIEFKNVPIAGASLMVTSDLKAVGGYDENVKLEDIYMWLALTSIGKHLVSYDKILINYRTHNQNTVRDVRGMYKARMEVLHHFDSNEDLYLKAVRKNELIVANGLALSAKREAIKHLIRGWCWNTTSLYILVKILIPKNLRLMRLIK